MSRVTHQTSLQHVLLALLALEPRSGYDLARWFAQVASHYWSARHSQIYPALADLDERGLVCHTEEPSERGPVRKVYSVTSAGREAVLVWAEQPASARPARDEQMVKALCFGLLPQEVVLRLLATVRSEHAEKLSLYEQIESELRHGVPGRPQIAPEARLGMLLTVRRGVGYEAAYVAWCDEAAELVRVFTAEDDPAR